MKAFVIKGDAIGYSKAISECCGNSKEDRETFGAKKLAENKKLI